MLYFEFFRKWFCARCGVSVWWNYSWSTCFSFSLIGDNGQTWTYLNVSGRSSRITFVAKNFLQTGVARTLICGTLCYNFFYHHSEIWSRKQRCMEMQEPLLTVKDWRSFCILGCWRWSFIFSELMPQESLQTPTCTQTVSSSAQNLLKAYQQNLLLLSLIRTYRLYSPSKWQWLFAVLQLRWYGMGNEHQDRHDTLSRQNTGSFFWEFLDSFKFVNVTSILALILSGETHHENECLAPICLFWELLGHAIHPGYLLVNTIFIYNYHIMLLKVYF